MNKKSNNVETKVKVLSKAVGILECFSVQNPVRGITEISNILGIGKSNTYNLVSSFVDLGYLEKTDNNKYKLGIKLLRYAFLVNEQLPYVQAVYDILVDTSRRTGELVFFGIPYNDQVLYLTSVHPLEILEYKPYRIITGEVAPLYCTGIGRAMLMTMPEEEWPSRITTNRVPFTIATETNYENIIKELRESKRRGYSIDNGEREPGIRCIGVPIYDIHGKLVAGLSISGKMNRITFERIPSLARILQENALNMRARLY